MLKKTLREIQKYLSPSSYLMAYWPKKKRKFVLGFRFIKRYLEGNLETNIFIQNLEQFKSELISENGLLPFEFELLKIIISIGEYETILNSLEDKSKKIAENLMNPEASRRYSAIKYLTEKNEFKALPLIMQRLFEFNTKIIEISITALQILGGQNSNPLLRLMAHHPCFEVHIECAKWLGIHGNQQQDVASVIQSLRQSVSVTALVALLSLYKRGVPGTEQAIPILEEYLKNQRVSQIHDYTLRHRIVVARNILYLISRKTKHHILYSQYSTDKNFVDRERNVVRKSFVKDPQNTMLLGGKLIGKVIIKIVPQRSYLAWRKAFTSKEFWEKEGFKYVPVEPILSKNGSLRVKKYKARKVVEGEKERWYQTTKGGETIYAVATKVLGPTLSVLPFGYRIEKSALDKLRNDTLVILGGLKKLGISYAPTEFIPMNHYHDNNFCVRFYNGIPRLYIIDFDHAILMA